MRSRSTRNKQNKAKRIFKFKLILDEGLPLPQNYPKLNDFHNLQHIVHDFKRSGIKDKPLYDLAKKENSLLIVLNTKDFKRLIKPNEPSVIALSTNITNKEADLKIQKALKNLLPSQTKGCLISISKSGITINPSY